MTTIIQQNQVRLIQLGVKVSRLAANLPQTAQTPIFTVSGGRVLITSFVGQVTGAIQAQATTVQLISTPTVGSAANLSIAGADLTGQAAGATVTLPAAFTSAPVLAAAGATLMPQMGAGILIPAGTIDLKTVASSTGQMQWDLTYTPLDDGASVAFA